VVAVIPEEISRVEIADVEKYVGWKGKREWFRESRWEIKELSLAYSWHWL